ncbi:hypothetical protein [Bowmanella sp. JS7-9]|uniref:Uncharacterized protein n=1 Tax=Pseudobowmanella zhangzhouensis TaxID=1537679 RepID=A0ABW1XE67_9ALTE|nr:hypothetical protein [Bowmanella sp. JS7-9]TBX20681.1 hypothetical protein TK45_14575 [Bowmanella sp. JS7-9]
MKKLIISSLLTVAMAGSAHAAEGVMGTGLSLETAIVASTVAVVGGAQFTGSDEQTSMDVQRRVCNAGDALDGNICVNTQVTTTVTVSGTGTVSIPVTVISTYPATVVTLH